MHDIVRFWDHIWWWFLHATGADNPSGVEYGFWSGWGSDLGEIALLAALYGIIRNLNCHVKGCWRPGFHPVNGTAFKTCTKHHPLGGHTHQDILDAHEAANNAV